MPYTIEFDGSILLILFSGTIEPRDLLQLAGETKKHERGDVIPHRITDISRVEKLNIAFENIFQLATSRKAIAFKNDFKSALVVNTDIQMGYARMFQTLNDHPQITLQIFRDFAAAKAWLTDNT